MYTYGHTHSLHDALPSLLMPARSRAMVAASPETISSATSAQLVAEMPVLAPSPCGLSTAPIMANLAMKPENGGMPAITSEQHRKARSEEHTSELQSLMRISYAVLCLK